MKNFILNLRNFVDLNLKEDLVELNLIEDLTLTEYRKPPPPRSPTSGKGLDYKEDMGPEGEVISAVWEEVGGAWDESGMDWPKGGL